MKGSCPIPKKHWHCNRPNELKVYYKITCKRAPLSTQDLVSWHTAKPFSFCEDSPSYQLMWQDAICKQMNDKCLQLVSEENLSGFSLLKQSLIKAYVLCCNIWYQKCSLFATRNNTSNSIWQGMIWSWAQLPKHSMKQPTQNNKDRSVI